MTASSNPDSYNAFYHRSRLFLSDFLEGRETLSLDDDVVVMDRVKYAPNAGTVLRHMPLFAGQALFLTHSHGEGDNGCSSRASRTLSTSASCTSSAVLAEEEVKGCTVTSAASTSTTRALASSSYSRPFVKEVLRMSMAFVHEKGAEREQQHPHPASVKSSSNSKQKLCADGDLFQVLRYLKSRGFFLLAIENEEVFEELNTGNRRPLSRLQETYRANDPVEHGEHERQHLNIFSTPSSPRQQRHLPYASLYLEHNPLLQTKKAVAFIFGGENGGLSKEALRLCDGGVFIPTRLKRATTNLPSSSTCRATSEVEVSSVEEPPTTTLQPRPRSHTCNLSIATSVVLSERFRRKMLGESFDHLMPEPQHHVQEVELEDKEHDCMSATQTQTPPDSTRSSCSTPATTPKNVNLSDVEDPEIYLNFAAAAAGRAGPSSSSSSSFWGSGVAIPTGGPLSSVGACPTPNLQRNDSACSASTTSQENQYQFPRAARYRVLLFYLYRRLTVDKREKFASHLESFCNERSIAGRLRVAKDGLNGCLGGDVAKLQEFVDAFKDGAFDGVEGYLLQQHEVGRGDGGENDSQSITTFEGIDWKWGGLDEKLVVAAEPENPNTEAATRAQQHMLHGPAAVRVCDEVVSLFGGCYNSNKDAALRYYKQLFDSAECVEALMEANQTGVAVGEEKPQETTKTKSSETKILGEKPDHHDNLAPATPLLPEEWKTRLAQENPENIVFFDARNIYETDVGYFDLLCRGKAEGAVREDADQHAAAHALDVVNNVENSRNKDVHENRLQLQRTPRLSSPSASSSSSTSSLASSTLPPVDRLSVRTRQFTDVPRQLVQNREKIRAQCAGKKVFAYCTGGVRCERATQLLRIVLEKEPNETATGEVVEPGILDGTSTTAEISSGAIAGDATTANTSTTELFQLRGGIHAFLDRYPDGGGCFHGKNFVFDNRMLETREDGVGGVVVGKKCPVGKCRGCGVACEDYTSNARCQKCRMRVLLCDTCIPAMSSSTLCVLCEEHNKMKEQSNSTGKSKRRGKTQQSK
ncbi:unnamed protein product [Amoebophrya sp. A25]|nr:unnamed protein product [Amoebophrya sp. A25]|eukprot:GSA25T00007295001.1